MADQLQLADAAIQELPGVVSTTITALLGSLLGALMVLVLVLILRRCCPELVGSGSVVLLNRIVELAVLISRPGAFPHMPHTVSPICQKLILFFRFSPPSTSEMSAEASHSYSTSHGTRKREMQQLQQEDQPDVHPHEQHNPNPNHNPNLKPLPLIAEGMQLDTRSLSGYDPNDDPSITIVSFNRRHDALPMARVENDDDVWTQVALATDRDIQPTVATGSGYRTCRE